MITISDISYFIFIHLSTFDMYFFFDVFKVLGFQTYISSSVYTMIYTQYWHFKTFKRVFLLQMNTERKLGTDIQKHKQYFLNMNKGPILSFEASRGTYNS